MLALYKRNFHLSKVYSDYELNKFKVVFRTFILKITIAKKIKKNFFLFDLLSSADKLLK